jgi:branched-subunit amino acid transport protein
MRRNADIKIPRFFYYILKFFVPVCLIVLFFGWLWQDLQSNTSIILMHGVTGQKALFQWISRMTMVGVITGIAILVGIAWRKKHEN